MRRKLERLGLVAVLVGVMWASGVAAAPVLVLPRDVTGCTAEMVRVGAVCFDKYEASVWGRAAEPPGRRCGEAG